MAKRVSARRARELLDYDPDTGSFRWKSRRNNRTKAGDSAGGPHPQGYVMIKIDGRNYPAHRVAWLIVHGVWPKDEIDHIDHDRANNRMRTLRETDHWGNTRNRRKRRTNTSGITGVHLRPGGRWQARITADAGRRISLGHFDTLEMAKVARVRALPAHGYHPNHGL